jgi:hypothetical protein
MVIFFVAENKKAVGTQRHRRLTTTPLSSPSRAANARTFGVFIHVQLPYLFFVPFFDRKPIAHNSTLRTSAISTSP